MGSIQYGPYPERKDVTAQIERWKKEDEEKDRQLKQEREKKKAQEAALNQ